jgi:Fur family transcriptional regulator, peroxide stress response regulator
MKKAVRKPIHPKPDGRALLEGALRARGARPTRQRRAIYAALADRLDHPTAETLHRAVRRRLPGMSLATVYTTLEVLVKSGLAGRVIGPDGVVRYDARTDAHDHRRCLRCGRIEDLERPGPPHPLDLSPSADFTPTGYRVEVTGYCSGCMLRSGAERPPGPTRSLREHEENER